MDSVSVLKGLILSAISAVIAAGLMTGSAIAQSASQQGARPAAWGQSAKKSDEFKTEKLSAAVDLPGVPQYTGRATFLSGLKYPNDTSGMRVGMTLGCREDESEILEWYKNALKLYSWRLINMDPKERVVTATKDGNTFTVRISPSRQPGYRTLVVLSFKYAK